MGDDKKTAFDPNADAIQQKLDKILDALERIAAQQGATGGRASDDDLRQPLELLELKYAKRFRKRGFCSCPPSLDAEKERRGNALHDSEFVDREPYR